MLAPAMQHRHPRVRPHVADQAGEIWTQQRIGEGRFGRAEAAPGQDLAFAQSPGMADLRLDHCHSAVWRPQSEAFRLGKGFR